MGRYLHNMEIRYIFAGIKLRSVYLGGLEGVWREFGGSLEGVWREFVLGSYRDIGVTV